MNSWKRSKWEILGRREEISLGTDKGEIIPTCPAVSHSCKWTGVWSTFTSTENKRNSSKNCIHYNSTAIKKKILLFINTLYNWYNETYALFFSVSNLINKSSYIIICNVKMGLFKFSTNIFIHEYTVNAGNVSSYDSLSRHVGLDILEYWSEMLRL